MEKDGFQMFIVKGIQVSEGITFGTLRFYKRKARGVEKSRIVDVKAEITRFQDAIAVAIGELQVLYESSVARVGQENAVLFGVHQMLLEDVEFVEEVETMIAKEKLNAEYAISMVSKKYEELLRKQKRAEDIKDISNRLIRILIDEERRLLFAEQDVLLVADYLLPSEIIQLDPKNICGIVLQEGTPTSHSVIFAKAMGIPILIQVEATISEENQGKFAVLNASEGMLCISPEEEFLTHAKEKKKEYEEYRANMISKVTVDGVIPICANIGSVEEAVIALDCGADGVGLVRSESFCLREGRILTEEEQFFIYKEIAQIMGQKRVIIRTWDFGEDKQMKNFPQADKRGILWCLENEEIFKAQLRAILRASVHGKLAMMFPMITSVQEVRTAKRLVEQVKKELEKEKISFKRELEVGIMIETPAAVIESRELAKIVDFVSIGTNDLLQYTFAQNRHEILEGDFYERCYPTLAKMLQTVIQNVHAEGKKVSICGEMATDTKLTKTFVKMGIDELSMSSNSIFMIREQMMK